LRTQALTFNLISDFYLIADLMAEIRRELMKKQRQLTSLTLIKNEAVQIELILEERRENQPLVKMKVTVIQSLLIKL
jgi:hypothetical protein